jgi:hypothetical protein
MKNCLNNLKKNNNRGQIAIVLLLVIAAALIFYAASINIGRTSGTKTVVEISSNTGASQLGSQMASYGQSVLQTQLGGRRRICALSGLFMSVIMAVVVIIIAVITIFTAGGGSFLAGIAMAGFSSMASLAVTASIVAVVASVAATSMTAGMIEPGLTNMWNKMTKGKNLTLPDQFIEQAVRAGIQAAATDSIRVPDMIDFDMDGIWGFDTSGPGPVARDEISRFGLYYTLRFKQLRNVTATDLGREIDEFAGALEELLYDGTDNWGIYDPLPTCPPNFSDPHHPCCYYYGSGVPVPSECNPCCVPDTVTNPVTGTAIDIRPSDCDVGSCQIGTSRTCPAQSPYGFIYPYVYDPYYENALNNEPPADPNTFISLREQLGKDDESSQFYKTPTPDPNGPQTRHPPVDEGFHIEDTTGYYVPTPPGVLAPWAFSSYTWPRPPGDPRTGIFSYLYKMKDWGVNLRTITPLNPLTPEHCHWCDARDAANCALCDPVTQPPEIPQLVLPIDPTTLTYNTTYFVDSANIILGNPPLTVDKVTTPTNIFANQNYCAAYAFNDTTTVPPPGFWKYGAERYCSPTDDWPYFANCPKHLQGTANQCTEDDGNGGFTVRDCLCEDSGSNPAVDPTLFNEDELDNVVYGLPEFIQWAEQFLKLYISNPSSMVGNVSTWYPEASEWIEPSSPPAAMGVDCYTCNALPGQLIVLRDKIREIRNRLEIWLQTSFEGIDCYDAWCVPPTSGAGQCPGGANPLVPPEEEATFDLDGDGTPGEAEEIVACLNYNVEGYDFVGSVINPVGTNMGNDFRFDRCGDMCNVASCSNLPRSLIPRTTYDPQNYTPGNPLDESDIATIINCFDNCNNANCQIMPLNQASTGTAYPYNTAIFNEAVDCSNPSAGANEPVGAMRANIIAALIQAGPSCDLNPNGWLTLTRQSALEATNQVAKFRKRRDFLAARVDEFNRMVGILTIADQRITEFLDGPVTELIAAVIASRASNTQQSLPYHVIYGWQSEPRPGDAEGLWHIVKVEARTPGRCDDMCGGFNAGANINTNLFDPDWPRVRSYRRALGFSRCYEFADDQGIVKFRTTRWDQQRPTGQMLRFPNQLGLWAFRGAPNPENRPGGDPGALGAGTPGDNTGRCGSIAIVDPVNLPVGITDIYRGAFLMNGRVTPTEASNPGPKQGLTPNARCWNDATALLSTGVVSETCATYYLGPRGMTFRFINCAEF